MAGALEATRVLVRFSEVCNKMPKKAQTFLRTLKKPKPNKTSSQSQKGKKQHYYKKKLHKEKKKAPRALSLSHVKIKKPLCKK